MVFRMKMALAAGVAALSMSVVPLAQADEQGRGNGGGNDKSASQERGGGGGNANRGRGDRGGGGEARRGGGGNGGGEARAERRDRSRDRAEERRDRRQDRREASRDRAEDRADRRRDRTEDRRDRVRDRIEDRVDRARDRREDRRDRRSDRRGNTRDRIIGLREDLRDVYIDERTFRERRSFFTRADRRGLIDGCPPGLAKKRNGCLPPGQARQRYRSYDSGFFGLLGSNRGRYFYDDGYLLSYGPNGLSGYIPLLGGALTIGEAWPSFYEPEPLPRYYESYYGLEPRSYRYADNVIYRVEPESAAILGVAALLTGSDIRIGQPMPRGYDVYNVPYAYRDRYYDSPRARYRYSDGYVYEIDPETALVVAAIDLAL